MRGNSERPRWALFVVGALLFAACAPLQALSDLPHLEREDLAEELIPQTSKFFAGDGKLLTTFHGSKNRIVVPLERIPQHFRQAIVAIEDQRFFEHEGIDFKGILRAAAANIRDGRISQGGSTITQQLVKNRIIAPGRQSAPDTLDRKLQEAALARQAEKLLSKEEILARYLNTVYFGNGAYGAQAAAQTYFGVPVKDLNVKQSATLAGVIRSPETYDPFDHPRRAEKRRDLVLGRLAELGDISEARADKLSSRKLGLTKQPSQKRHAAPYFVDYVKRLLVHHPDFSFLGKTPQRRSRRLFTGGLKVYTTLDRKMQESAESAIDQVLTSPSDPYGSIVAIDPRNGHVKAMVGGRDYFNKKDDFSKVNLAIAGEPGLGRANGKGDDANRAAGTGRQAGSAFKPFALAAALDRGVSLSRVFSAPPCETFEGEDAGRDWRVCNYGSSSFGSISLLDATIKSVNVVFAKLILDIGPSPVVAMARAMGIETELAAVPSATLGTNVVNPLGMAEAFGTLATNGRHHEPVAIKKIVNHKGEVIYRAQRESVRTVDPGVAYLTTDALRNVIREGTGTAADIGRPAAGKTGTAQEYRDAWFAGYVPQLVASVWVGYPSASIEMKTSCATTNTSICRPTRITVSGGTWPAMIWQRFMSAALEGKPVKGFKIPRAGLERVVIDSRTGCEATSITSDSYAVETFRVKGSGPSESECADRLAELQAAIAAAQEAAEEEKKDEKKDEKDGGGGPPEGKGNGRGEDDD